MHFKKLKKKGLIVKNFKYRQDKKLKEKNEDTTMNKHILNFIHHYCLEVLMMPTSIPKWFLSTT